MRKTEDVGIRKVLKVKVRGKVGRRWPWLGWQEQNEKDMVKVGLGRRDSMPKTWCSGNKHSMMYTMYMSCAAKQ